MSFGKLRGQGRAARMLAGLLETGRVPTSLLLAGMDGVGKTLAAYEFAKSLLCRERGDAGAPCGGCADCLAAERGNHPDLKCVNAAYQASLRNEEPARQRSLRVETIRHLRRDMELQSLLGGWKVAVVEDAHTLETQAANALLKILEEPPPLTLWVLVSSQKERLPRTVVSRCFLVPFSPLPDAAVLDLLAEKGIERGRAERLAALSEGSVGRALELAASPGYPESLTAGPLAAAQAAEALPRELYLARAQVELALFALSQDLRLRRLEGRLDVSRAGEAQRGLALLRQALRANADPKLVLTLAGAQAR